MRNSLHHQGEKLLKCGPADSEAHLYGVWKSGCSRSWRTGWCTGCCWRGSRSSLGPGDGAGLCGGGWVSGNLTDWARSGFGGGSVRPSQPLLLTGDTVKTNSEFQPSELKSVLWTVTGSRTRWLQVPVVAWQTLLLPGQDSSQLQDPLDLNLDSQWLLYWLVRSRNRQECGEVTHQRLHKDADDSRPKRLTLSLYKPRTTSDILVSSTGSPWVLTTQPGRGGKFVAAKSNLGGETLISVSGTGLWRRKGCKNEIRRDGVELKMEKQQQKGAPHRSAVIFSPPPGSSAGCGPPETQTIVEFAHPAGACLRRSRSSCLPSARTQAAVVHWVQQRRGEMRECRAEIRSRLDKRGGGIGRGNGGGGLGAA